MNKEEVVLLARLRKAGSSVGDADEVISGLLSAFDQVAEDLEKTWLVEHDEFCTNMENCESFGGPEVCHSPKPESLQIYKRTK